ncbi:MAG: hypothetical protein L0196_02660 [candidate division Zixibacteria bacterium]|nr:hypothetical protein [candidate division Zixibacteria bacterium]
MKNELQKRPEDYRDFDEMEGLDCEFAGVGNWRLFPDRFHREGEVNLYKNTACSLAVLAKTAGKEGGNRRFF